MKKVFANWKMSLTALFLVGGLMLVSNSAQAQSGNLQQNPASPEIKGVTGNWAVESDAIQLLEGELQGTIATALATLPNNGQQYLVWKYKAELYDAVRASIVQGVTVPKAVRINYAHLAGSPSQETVISPLSQNEWQTIFNELVDLLTN